jgi:hypothetical protein
MVLSRRGGLFFLERGIAVGNLRTVSCPIYPVNNGLEFFVTFGKHVIVLLASLLTRHLDSSK